MHIIKIDYIQNENKSYRKIPVFYRITLIHEKEKSQMLIY